MAAPSNALDVLAAALRYPSAETPAELETAAAGVAADAPGLAAALRALAAWVGANPARAEERYTQLFDLAPLCAPHVGWHLFGEDYARGQLLSNLRVALRDAGLSCTGELPDHLVVLLELFGRLDGEGRALLARHLLLPGLVKMAGVLAEAADPYPAAIRALPELIEALGGPLEAPCAGAPAEAREEARA